MSGLEKLMAFVKGPGHRVHENRRRSGIEPLERRTLFSANLVQDGDFQTLYEPGTQNSATMPANGYTFSNLAGSTIAKGETVVLNPAPGVYLTGVVTYNDPVTPTGSTVALPYWSEGVLGYPAVYAVINNGGNSGHYTDKTGLDNYINVAGLVQNRDGNIGDYPSEVTQTLTGQQLRPNTTYTFQVEVGGGRLDLPADSGPSVATPLIVSLSAGSTVLTPTVSSMPPAVAGQFATWMMTYVTDDSPLPGDLEVHLGIGANPTGQEADFDNVVLTATPIPITPAPVLEVLSGVTPLSPTTTVMFNDSTQSQPGTTQTFTIDNTGTAPLTVSDISVPEGFSKPGPISPIAANSSAKFQITVDTTSPGAHAGSVGVSSNGGNLTFPVTANVLTPTPVLEVSLAGTPIPATNPAPVTFAESTQFQPGASQSFTINNPGTAPLVVSDISVPLGFIKPAPISAPISPGASATFQIAVDTAAPGPFPGSVVVSSNGGNLTFPVTASVVAPPPQGLVVSLTTQKFPKPLVGGSKKDKGQVVVSLKNISGMTLDGSAIVTLFASSSSSSVAADSINFPATSVTLKKMKNGITRKFKITVTFASVVSATETLFLVARVMGPGINLPTGVFVTGPQVQIAAAR